MDRAVRFVTMRYSVLKCTVVQGNSLKFPSVQCYSVLKFTATEMTKSAMLTECYVQGKQSELGGAEEIGCVLCIPPAQGRGAH